MNILIIGASGRVGTILTRTLLARKYTVTGTSTGSGPLIEDQNFHHIHLDLTENLKDLKKHLTGEFDAVFFVAGSRADSVLDIDLDGAVKMMRIAENKGIERFIMLSFAFSLEPEKWKEEGLGDIKSYCIAKQYADEWLIRNTQLNYTILQPCALTETEGSDKIAVNIKKHLTNSVNNVANTLAEVLNNPKTFKKVITMHDGDTPIKEAIDNL